MITIPTRTGSQQAQLGGATRIVAAADSHPDSQAAAHFVCDGVDDQLEIQAAINALPPAGGKVLLMEGAYHISGGTPVTTEGRGGVTLNWIAGIDINKSNVSLEGVGAASKIVLDNGVVTTPAVNGQFCLVLAGRSQLNIIEKVSVKNLYIDANMRGQAAGAWVQPIGLNSVNRFLIKNNHTFDSYTAIAPGLCNHGIIAHNNIVDVIIGDGIGPNYCTYIDVSNNVIVNAHEGLDLEISQFCSFVNNLMVGVDTRQCFGVIIAATTDSLVANNIIIGLPTATPTSGTRTGIHFRTTVGPYIIPSTRNIVQGNYFAGFQWGLLIDPEAHNNVIQGNVFERNHAHNANVSHLQILRDNVGLVTENSGTATFSGTGTATTFTITHGLITTPRNVSLEAKSSAAATDKFWTADATNITVTFVTAPPAGTNNIVLNWEANTY